MHGKGSFHESFRMKISHCLSTENRFLTHNTFVSFALITKTTKQSKKGGASTIAFSIRRKNKKHYTKNEFFSSLATEKFLFVSFLFCSQRETAIHIHTQWSNVHEFVLKENK